MIDLVGSANHNVISVVEDAWYPRDDLAHFCVK